MTPGPRKWLAVPCSGGGWLVPAPDHMVAVLLAEDAECCCLEPVVPAAFGWLAEPAGGQDPQYVSVGKDQRVALHATHFSDDAIDSATDIRRCFAAGPTVPPERPVGIGRGDLLGRETLVSAVVPL